MGTLEVEEKPNTTKVRMGHRRGVGLGEEGNFGGDSANYVKIVVTQQYQIFVITLLVRFTYKKILLWAFHLSGISHKLDGISYMI